LASYTRLIEFKVKDTELTRAVNKLSKTLTSIDKTLKSVDKKLEHIATKGFGLVAKEAGNAEKSINKVAKAVEKVNRGVNAKGKAWSQLERLFSGNNASLIKKVALIGGLSAAVLKADKDIRKLVGGVSAFTQANNVAIQSILGLVAGLEAVRVSTPFVYNLGKGFRQLTHDIGTAYGRIKKFGMEGGLLSFAPKGSHMGNRFDKLRGQSFDGDKAAAAVEKATFKGQSSPLHQQSLRSLESRRTLLQNNKKIQESLVALTGKHLQASIQVRKAMIGYNLELAKTKVVQAFVTADLWAMQKAWQGIVSTIKGAGNLFGGLLGGKFGGTGQGLGVITLSRSIEVLTGKLGFLNKAWIENINKIALWSARASEAITAVNVAYGVLSTGLNAASWTAGAIKGFVDFEKQAVLSLNKVNAARRNLDKQMSSWLSKNKPGFGKKGGSIGPAQNKGGFLETMFGPIGLMMGDRMKGELQGIYGGESKFKDRTPLMKRLEDNLANARQELSKLHSTSDKFRSQLVKVVQLEERINKEIAKRKELYKQISPTEIAKTEAKEREESIKRGNKLRADADKKIKESALDRYKEIQNRWKLEESNHRREVQRIKERNQLAKQRRAARGAAWGRFGENVMLGAGFPMLFGGGPGAVAGGLTGAIGQSALGSKGFGMQILFSALGQQVDAFVGKIATLGKAFNDINPDLDAVIGSLGETNTAYGKHLEMLKKIKGEAAAMAEASKKLTGLIGKQGVTGFKDFGDDTQEFANEWKKFSTLVMASLAQWINATGILGRLTDSVSRAARFKSASRAANEGNKELAILFAQRSGIERRTIKGSWKDRQLAESELKTQDDRIDAAEKKRQRGLFGGKLFGQGDDVIANLEKEKALIEQKTLLGDKDAAIQQKISEIMEKNPKLKEAEVRAAVKAVAVATEEYTAKQKLNDIYREIGQTIEDGLVSAIEGAIKGTKTLGDVASSVLSQIANKMLKLGVNKLLTMIPGVGDFFKADGGPVSGGTPYIVGEKGPELFVPKSSGNIVPNHAMGGSMVVNVDASGSSAEGDDDRSRQLGELIGAAVQSEIIRQQRPGGTLY
jgi:hypothetical protein